MPDGSWVFLALHIYYHLLTSGLSFEELLECRILVKELFKPLDETDLEGQRINRKILLKEKTSRFFVQLINDLIGVSGSIFFIFFS